MKDAHHSIQAVGRITGLSPYVIRIWEQRYKAVVPARTESNRRVYTEEEIARLKLLRRLTQAGHGIGHIARLPTEKLGELAAEASVVAVPSREALVEVPSAEELIEESLSAIQRLDARALDEVLRQGATVLGAMGLQHHVIAPLVQEIGDRWRDGSFTAAHEHFATAAIRVFLGHAAQPFGAMHDAPVLVVATPAGQVHELGALLAGAAAVNFGWRVIYLGASLPAAEIAGAAAQKRARAVALSLVYPEDDPLLEGELLRLRESLPGEVVVLAGGRATASYRGALGRIGAILVGDLKQLGSVLDDLRKPAGKSGS